MKTKITLSIEKSTKERAKRYVKRHQVSVSQMAEDFLESISQKKEEEWQPEEGHLVEQM